MTNETKYYGVSSGDGNNGVSQIFPDYIVRTNEPWLLARLAAISSFKEGNGQQWAKENMDIDGESDFTIYANFHESKETQDEIAAMQSRLDDLYAGRISSGDETQDDDEITELSREIENYGLGYTWFILEIYPWDSDYKEPCDTGRPIFETLESAFGAELVAAERKTESA